MAIVTNGNWTDISLHPKQLEVLQSEANEVLFGGACGGGKSLLVRVVAIMFCYEIPGFHAGLFRRTYRELYDTHMKGPGSFYELLGAAQESGMVRINRGEIRFANKSVISLNHCQNEEDVHAYQGAEFNMLAIDELCHFSEDMFKYLRTRVRLGGLEIPEEHKGKLPLILCTSNPGGPYHNWVKDAFRPDLLNVVRYMDGEGEGGTYRTFIPARLADNPDMLKNDPSYREKLAASGDAATVRALLEGDWDVVSGSMFGEVWKKDLHVINPFPIPVGWDLWRGADDGFMAPACCLWFAKDPVHDRTYVIKELYRSGMLPEDFARQVMESDQNLIVREADGTIRNARYELSGIIDPATFARTGQSNNGRMAIPRGNVMNNLGCQWREAEKYPGSRVQGVQHIHRMLAIQKDGLPGLQIFNNCIQVARALPTAPRDRKNPEDIDDEFEIDHAIDALRYGLQWRDYSFRRVRIGGI